MKRLVILRHAKSSWDNASGNDRDRPLNERGRAAATLMGKELKRRGADFDLVLASPAERVRETLERLQLGYGALPEIYVAEELYLASVPALLRKLRALDDGAQSALLVGHNPGLQELVLTLVEPGEPRREQIQEKFPTAAAALLEMPSPSWTEISSGSATLRDIILPRLLEP